MSPAMAAPVMPTPVVTAECRGCGACLLTCPEHAIRPAPHLIVLDELCTRCGECVEVCPVDAVHLTTSEVVT
jgi:electron transport complex protein RnfB